MPPRISRSSVLGSKPQRSSNKKSNKSQKRALDAFSIASHDQPDGIKIRQHRLGESDLSSHSHRKRARDEDEDDLGSEEEPSEGRRHKQRKAEKGRFDELDVSEGSDSEGNTWTMGHVDEDDDSDIDSDEAFGESDEERFEGWSFRGSSSSNNQKKGKIKSKRRIEEIDPEDDGGEIDLNEEDGMDGEEDEDDFGEDAIDLAMALDQYEDSEEEKSKKFKKKSLKLSGSDEPTKEEDFAMDVASDFSTSDEEEDHDPSKMAQLKNLISSLPTEEEPQTNGPRKAEVHESGAPSEFGVFRKVDLASFKPKVTDPEKKKSLKLLRDDTNPSKRNDIARKLDAPLPKRQQDKLDRAIANKIANETLGRWVDTVKQNRRAEHISFPMKHPDAGESYGESRLIPTTTSTPANDLESTIQSILQQSGLSNGKDDEDQFQKWEELQTNKLPLGEVQARRAELRKQRELLFREEVCAKRIKKIKSKAYRRVHRKERERLIQREKDALRADGIDVSEDEREYNDRRRAEERMGAKHRESKWAKGIKQSGRAAWDEDARAGVTEMARRNEELRRRIEGKEVHNEDEDHSDFSSEEEDGGGEGDKEAGLQRQLSRLKQNPFSVDNSKLGSMAFMQKAEAARKARNDEDIERMRRELAGEETPSEDEDENAAPIGRRKMGPSSKPALPAIRPNVNEFEERPGSDDEAEKYGNDADTTTEKPVNGLSNGAQKAATSRRNKPKETSSAKDDVGVSNPYLMKPAEEKKSEKKLPSLWKAHDSIVAVQEEPKSKSKSKSKKLSSDRRPEPQISAPHADGWQTVTYGNDSGGDQDGDGIENESIDLDVVLRNQALTAKGFAGDDVEADFAAEKNAIIEDEDDKVIDNTLPGWGTWVGEGLSKRAQEKNKGKILTTQNGIKADKRKDAKLDRVIINEKKVKKNNKFMATSLPFRFESREQYERSLRLPKGPEWTTKQTFQDGTKPRVLVKQGIIRPLAKPLV
ncbi:Utp14-domain-containing protein [Zopfia rhizophila CBS 207.26]|uniref:Utp14-domain-containing protein n=1 Tax=Zopfia rhizophila CBS 207.26 TaxID=1314779 RepID=A0A6A6ERW6_9PEZI|nr:Utp14-domain-containing protein [Zopfia rhizophila CBS 207.26]